MCNISTVCTYCSTKLMSIHRIVFLKEIRTTHTSWRFSIPRTINMIFQCFRGRSLLETMRAAVLYFALFLRFVLALLVRALKTERTQILVRRVGACRYLKRCSPCGFDGKDSVISCHDECVKSLPSLSTGLLKTSSSLKRVDILLDRDGIEFWLPWTFRYLSTQREKFVTFPL